MKAWELKTGQRIRHSVEVVYLKTISHTMGNIIHVTARRPNGELINLQLLREWDVEVVQ